MSTAQIDEEDGTPACAGFSMAAIRKPIEIGELGESGHAGKDTFFMWPFFGPLLFDNLTSDARDHCANERILSFHLKHEPSKVELRMAKPLGAIFWVLSVASLAIGFGNYIKTINKYSRRAAIVQTGWRTQAVIFLVALCIIATCVVLLIVTQLSED
ncbi:hypothetical protein MKZ38_009371 [Zalerion maritima]|uniref:DUF202 domain-containing protein n=1 Tax=Zalerion maritima TaxID=339359 RepID=A0AAD5RGJ1_9PEZI|nr:hypothetical protein MKZ38_009371 [Zalerion maritima]